jgi:hypothetical protein
MINCTTTTIVNEKRGAIVTGCARRWPREPSAFRGPLFTFKPPWRVYLWMDLLYSLSLLLLSLSLVYSVEWPS